MPFPVGSSAPRSSNMVFDGDLRVPAGFKLVTPQIDALSNTIDVNAVQVNANTELQLAEGNLLFVDNIHAVGSNGIEIDYPNPMQYLRSIYGSAGSTRAHKKTTSDITVSDTTTTVFSFVYPIPQLLDAGTCRILFTNTTYKAYFSGAVNTYSVTHKIGSGVSMTTTKTYTVSPSNGGYVALQPDIGVYDIPAGSNTIVYEITCTRISGADHTELWQDTLPKDVYMQFKDVVAYYNIEL